MLEILSILKGTPLPTVLTVGGFIFLFLGIVGNIKQLQTEPLAPAARKWAAGTGVVLLLLGLALYIAPATQAGVAAVVTPVVTAAPPTNSTEAVVTASQEAGVTPTQEVGLTPTLNAQGFPTMVDDKGSAMVLIPGGSFLMGSETGFPDEVPVRQVALTQAYWMDTYEVTNKQYGACVNATVCVLPHKLASNQHTSYFMTPDFAEYPVIFVDWNMADTFCHKWRDARLPTEAEWEFAARGKDERTYPWGSNNPNCNLANFSHTESQRCVGDAQPVTNYPTGVSPFGLYNMSGNVWEWVADWYSPSYAGMPSQDPTGLPAGNQRVLRGGSWVTDAANLTTTVRYGQAPISYAGDFGFRCVRAP